MSACDAAWRRFTSLVANEFTDTELALVSRESLRNLMKHYGVTNAIETARLEVQWSILQGTNDVARTTMMRQSAATELRAASPKRDSTGLLAHQQRMRIQVQTPRSSQGTATIPSPIRPSHTQSPFHVQVAPPSPRPGSRSTKCHAPSEAVGTADPNSAGARSHSRERTPRSGKKEVSPVPGAHRADDASPSHSRLAKHFPNPKPAAVDNPNERHPDSDRTEKHRIKAFAKGPSDGPVKRLTKVILRNKAGASANPNVAEKPEGVAALFGSGKGRTSSKTPVGYTAPERQGRGLAPTTTTESSVMPGWGTPRTRSAGRKAEGLRPKDNGIF